MTQPCTKSAYILQNLPQFNSNNGLQLLGKRKLYKIRYRCFAETLWTDLYQLSLMKTSGAATEILLNRRWVESCFYILYTAAYLFLINLMCQFFSQQTFIKVSNITLHLLSSGIRLFTLNYNIFFIEYFISHVWLTFPK